MAVKENVLSPQLKALGTSDLSPMIRMAGLMAPRVIKAFLPGLDEKQKRAFEQVMPVGGEKKIYIQLMGTPTPPIVVGLSQPMKLRNLPESKVREQQINGMRLTIDDLQLLSDGLTLGKMLKLVWRLKGQIITILKILLMFWPFIRLGPSELKDLKEKMVTHFKPMLDLLPKPK